MSSISWRDMVPCSVIAPYETRSTMNTTAVAFWCSICDAHAARVARTATHSAHASAYRP